MGGFVIQDVMLVISRGYCIAERIACISEEPNSNNEIMGVILFLIRSRRWNDFLPYPSRDQVHLSLGK
jgi:hypothetical protein